MPNAHIRCKNWGILYPAKKRKSNLLKDFFLKKRDNPEPLQIVFITYWRIPPTFQQNVSEKQHTYVFLTVKISKRMIVENYYYILIN